MNEIMKKKKKKQCYCRFLAIFCIFG